MSAKYYQCYFDSKESLGYKNFLKFEKLIKDKNWAAIVDKYGVNIIRLVCASANDDGEKLNRLLEHHLDIDFSLDDLDSHICLKFDTFTSQR